MYDNALNEYKINVIRKNCEKNTRKTDDYRGLSREFTRGFIAMPILYMGITVYPFCVTHAAASLCRCETFVRFPTSS